MRITIAERLQPFSHTPGISFILPGSPLRFQIFPALLRIHNLSGKEPALVSEVAIDIKGPVDDFTAMQDLEKGGLKIWGHAADGYFRYRIAASLGQSSRSHNFTITVEKKPQGRELSWSCSQGHLISHGTETKQTLIFSQHAEKSAQITPCTLQDNERLSLGNHKAQDWDKIYQRIDMTEIFPLWLRLGQQVPSSECNSLAGTAALLDPCRSTIDKRDMESILPAFHNLFLAGFDKGLSPRLTDEQHQGFRLPPLEDHDEISPLCLLTQGAALIRRLFVNSEVSTIQVLPALPADFHCGRFVHVRCQAGMLDMEWSKKTIRRIIFSPSADAELLFVFQTQLKQFRLRQKESDKGTIISCNTPIRVTSDSTYLFDRFQK